MQQAQIKRFRQAAKIAEEIHTCWSCDVSFSKFLVQQVALGDLLEQVNVKLCEWHTVITEADTLANRAKSLLETDTANPQETQVLTEALALFQKSNILMYDQAFIQSVRECEQEILKRQKYQAMVAIAQEQTNKLLFKQAVKTYLEAQELYQTTTIQTTLEFLALKVKEEEAYEVILQRATLASSEGKLHGAIALLESALTNFPRSDGRELLEQLKRTVKGKEQFRAGLNAERAGNFKEAIFLYETAKSLLPDPIECQIRLGFIALKIQDWTTAISQLEGIGGEQAAYLRGFTYAQQGNLQQAECEWQSLSHPEIESQRQILKTLSQRERLNLLQNIEQPIKNGNLEAAKVASAEFIQKFGSDQLVEGNLNEHIQPRLEATVWQSANWRIIAEQVEKNWLADPNITTVHNWVVANYYHAVGTCGVLHDLIIVLSTALANLTHDPTLKDVPWLENQPVDLELVSLELKQILEEAIDNFKDRDINEYLQLRDRYRLELVALRLMGNPPIWGMKVKDVLLTPGCYNRYLLQWQNILVDGIKANQKILQSLYTPWGLAVAACLEGDTLRARKIKPSTQPSEAEIFAQKFVAYYEGCYQLQQQKWREAIIYLKQAQSEIKANGDWQEEIDRLCGLQRRAISEMREHVEFAQFWFDLLGSQPARSYLAEYKTEQLREKLVNEQIAPDKALGELQDLKRIDEHNPIMLDLIARIEFIQEIEQIEKLLRRNEFAAAVRKAKHSHHDQVKFKVAEFFIYILIDAGKNGDLTSNQIQQLGRWAYEICPDEYAFQEVYHSLRLR
ncbi:peptidase M, neutral zinc metallopeptidase site [Iningainema sp. BLCCT55]|uniref:Peptidase M, neutral zinc metallopeptidase site n=2 Tax=Iningainema TaxID=1932705 RepID=A0A8J7CAK2_9CYAN|nr:peptidase M, neutral zinc metallopeptidase site [Iningainema tapete]MBD2777211.1 peptidase M, neutral zinc metallopeptidase site [Iningainema tapete BLCC-T55]